MKKIFGFLIISLFSVVLLSSCQKCAVCEYSENGQLIDTKERCSSNSEENQQFVKDFENVGYTCTFK